MDERILRVVEFLKANPSQSTSLEDLARVAHLSLSRFSHLFKAETGMAPTRFAKLQRIHRAAALLERTSLSAKEIALSLGFEGETQFGRAFKRVFDLSPSEYRLKCRLGGTPTEKVP